MFSSVLFMDWQNRANRIALFARLSTTTRRLRSTQQSHISTRFAKHPANRSASSYERESYDSSRKDTAAQSQDLQSGAK